tara:strand:- start:36 stop:365 length:330 start_codon:yes stop_codon:yes gene_type:complete
MPNGDCYEANGRFITQKINDPKEKFFKLCHGVGILPRDGKPFGHAWIEMSQYVMDLSNGNKHVLSKKKYYELGGIPVKGHKIYKYTPEQAGLKMVRNRHWGPWDSNPPR